MTDQNLKPVTIQFKCAMGGSNTELSHLTAGGTFFLPQASPPKVPGEHPTKISTSGALPYFLGLSGGYPASTTLAVTGLTPNLLGDPSRNAHFGGVPPRNFRR
jgi:hypothetical protein